MLCFDFNVIHHVRLNRPEPSLCLPSTLIHYDYVILSVKATRRILWHRLVRQWYCMHQLMQQ
jgi:hypothetical protein